ncbi:hypothetical protein ACHQM5_015134 [Ranunculus cassubicifolius]
MYELEEKERVANESVEGLMMDIATAEEEITRWKVAAEQEAAAGRAVEQEFIAKVSQNLRLNVFWFAYLDSLGITALMCLSMRLKV